MAANKVMKKDPPSESFVINIDFRTFGAKGLHPWNSGFVMVKEIGANTDGKVSVSLFSKVGGAHLNVFNARGFKFKFAVALGQHTSRARFRWSLFRPGKNSFHKGEVSPKENQLSFETPASELDEAVFGIAQVEATASAGDVWKMTNIEITGFR